MRITLSLAIAIVVTKCDITSVEYDQTFKDAENGSRAKRQVLMNYYIPNSTWKDGVFYMFNTSDSNVKKAFKMGVKVWSDATCINFIESKDAHDKVIVVKQATSWSKIGQIGGNQILSLIGAATEGTAVHEIGHVLGLYHTMSRFDRDDNIQIIWQHITRPYISNFNKVSESNAGVYGLQYDYGSAMHYSEISGSSGGRPTMIAKDSLHQKTMGSQLIAFSDIYMINEHHGCSAKCNKATSAKCQNEGFPHPRNCSMCICPGGYGGTLCDRRPSGCGEDLVATSQKQVVNCKLGSRSSVRDHFEFCNYIITAPEGKKVEVQILSISSGYDFPGCVGGGVEIKAQKDQKLTGYRFCSVKGRTVISSSNRVPLIVYNRFYSMNATFTYRYAD